jgi:hypothetical protein
MLDRDVRDMKAHALIGGKIGGGWGRRNDLRTLLIPAFLTLRLLRTRLIELFLLGRGGDRRGSREGEEGEEEKARGAAEYFQLESPYTFRIRYYS